MDIVERLRIRADLKSPNDFVKQRRIETEAANEIERLRVLVRDAFDEGFNEGKNGGWIVGPNFPWKKSYSRAKLVGAALAVAALKESE